MRFCCGITLYYPSQIELENLLKYKNIFEKIYVFDNTEGSQVEINKDILDGCKEIIYISGRENKGLAIAYNNMCKNAVLDEFEYICIFDQDSIISLEELDKMIKYIKGKNDENVGAYVPNVIYSHKKENTINNSIVEVEWAISSGSFINLNVYNKTQGFDENYFIDRLDYDYCVQIRGLGYKIIQNRNIGLYQNLGEEKEGIFGKRSEHSPLRHYYIYRNRLYFYFKKNNSINSFFKVCSMSVKHVLQIILLETRKREKLIMIKRAKRDFKNNKMGRYLEKISD